MDQNEQTQSAFSGALEKGLSYTDLLFDNIFGTAGTPEQAPQEENSLFSLPEIDGAKYDPMSLPNMAMPEKDPIVGRDELGFNIRETVTGVRYQIQPVTSRDISLSERGDNIVKNVGAAYEAVTEDPLGTATGLAKGIAQDVANTVSSFSDPNATNQDAMNLAGMMMGASALRLLDAYDPNVTKGATKVAKVFSAGSKNKAEFQRDILEDSEFESLDEETLFPKSESFVTPSKFILDETSWIASTTLRGELAHNQKKILESFKEEEFLKLSQELPHFKDPKYKDFIETNIKPVAKYLGVRDSDFLSLLHEVENYYPAKEDPEILALNLPKKAPIGNRAGAGPDLPSDKRAEALGFKDTVYHVTQSPKGFTSFNIARANDSGQDLLGVHVGTARAAAERFTYVTDSNPEEELSGHTLELKARTTDPLTKQEISKMLKKSPEEIFDDPVGLFSEEDVNTVLREYGYLLYPAGEPRPRDANKVAAINLRRELAREGFTHIPYINDIEDPGSTSLIMLVDRPKGSPAVLRDRTAQFDPEKIESPDLRFAEGGMVEEEQMNRLMQEGGMADDGMSREPVTGNNIPPGALASEVRDDVDTKLSGGEYVVPADVLRYYGVRFFEDLRSQAKQGMMEMESAGRIGGVPVDPRGVPMQGQDEELTPEEEQMLAQAMSSTSGMAEGGMAFDRGDFTMTSNAMTSKLYFNPTTGKKQNINFMGDQALGGIPDGFVPWTQALQDSYNATKPATPESKSKKRSPYNDDDEPVATNSYDEWADENYEAITNDPFKFGMDLLKAPNDDGGVLGILTGKDKDILNVAGANTALKRLEAQGKVNSPEYVALAEEVKKYVGGLSLVERGLIASGVFGMGGQYGAALKRKEEEETPPVGTPPVAAPANTRTNDEVSGGGPPPNGAGNDPVVGGANNDRIGTSYNSPNTNRDRQSAADPRPATPAPTPTPTSSQGGSNTYSSSTYGSGNASYTPTPRPGSERFAEGGLVSKPKKTRAKTKGLAGKQ